MFVIHFKQYKLLYEKQIQDMAIRYISKVCSYYSFYRYIPRQKYLYAPMMHLLTQDDKIPVLGTLILSSVFF